ncbi:MarR family transcriptional regulator [Streptomyces sp. Q6]|uniref:MarR family transcriptional regulator n=1 Tax=Streptomyces citrinus TaxID=3118173 RepID=A0ACD5ANX7_9ACTN
MTTSDTADLAVEVSGLLGVVRGRAHGRMLSGLVSTSQMRALLVLGRLEGGNQRALGEALGSSPPATSRLCDRLEAAGLLERRLSETSRREFQLFLSARGRVLLDEVRAAEVEEVRTMLDAMPTHALGQLAEGLAAFRDAAAAVVDGAGMAARRAESCADRTGGADQGHLRIARPA